MMVYRYVQMYIDTNADEILRYYWELHNVKKTYFQFYNVLHNPAMYSCRILSSGSCASGSRMHEPVLDQYPAHDSHLDSGCHSRIL
ncbi:hypothetical protein ANCCAN_08727, partial [Ancylostoma caninum]